MRHIRSVLACIVALGVAACGSDNPGDPTGKNSDPLYMVNVKLLNGPTNTAPGAYNGDAARTVVVTPNSMSVTITSIGLGHAGTNEVVQSQTQCAATFSRYNASNSEIGACQPAFPAGSYDVVYLTLSRNVTVLLADTSSGYYTTPTGSTTSSSGLPGAPFATTVGATDTTLTFVLPAKLAVDAQTSPTLGLVVDASHSLRPSNNSGHNGLVVSHPFILATVGLPTSMEYYVRSPLRGAAAYCAQDCALPRDLNGVTVVYAGANTPAAIALHYFQIMVCPSAAKTIVVTDPRSYMGVDATTSDLTWAVATSDSWSTYASVLQLKRVGAVGTTTTLWCADRSSVTAPPGGTFSTAPTDLHSSGSDRGPFTLAAK